MLTLKSSTAFSSNLSAAVLAVMLCANGAFAVSYQVTSLATERTHDTNSYSINEHGTVASTVTKVPAGGNANDIIYTIETIDVVGNKRSIGAFARTISTPTLGLNTFIRNTLLLDDGSVIVERFQSFSGASTGRLAQFVRLTPTGRTIETTVGPVEEVSETVIAEAADGRAPSGLTQNVFDGNNATFQFGGVNSNGDVAAMVTQNGTPTIVKLAANGQSHQVVAQPDAVWVNLSLPDINDTGDVAWIAQAANRVTLQDPTNAVFVGDGSSPNVIRNLITADGASGLGPDINSQGTIAAYQPDSLSTYDNVGAETTIVSGSAIDRFIEFVGINDYDQVAYLDEKGLYVDGTKVADVAGETADLGEIIRIETLANRSLSNTGQLASVLHYNGLEGPPDTVLTRFDPEGSTPDNPLLPFVSNASGENDVALNIFNGLGVEAPIWVDPVVATGFTYTQGAGGENFASLIIPDALPLGDDDFTLEFSYGLNNSFSGSLGVGSIFDFTVFDALGVSEFTISGIDVGEMIDPTDPFVVGLTFVDGGFQSTLSIDATTFDTDAAPVPLPASLSILLTALGLASLLRLRQS